MKKEYAEFREVKKENQSKTKMSESVANLSILYSSGFLHQINPGNGSTFNASVLASKKKVNIASSVFGLPTTVPVEDELADIQDVTLGLTHGHSDSEEVGDKVRKLVKHDEQPNEG